MNEDFLVIQESTPEWESISKIAREDDTHPLWKNYQNIDLHNHLYMIIYMNNGNPAGLHGIYNNGRWPKGVARFGNRAYLSPEFRDHRSGAFILARNYKFVLDNYNKWGQDVLIVTRGVQYNDPEVSFDKFEKFCKWLERTSGHKVQRDNRLYKSCPNETKDCYQFTLWYNPKGIDIQSQVPSVSIEEWKELDEIH